MTPEEKREYNRKWNEAHPGYFTEKSKEWGAQHPERRHEQQLKSQHKYRAAHPNKDREYYEANRDQILKQMKDYRVANLDVICERKAEYYANGGYKLAYPHRAIWEEHFGIKIPEGFVVHHKDKDHLNNTPNNLLCLPLDEHVKLHWILGDHKIKEE